MIKEPKKFKTGDIVTLKMATGEEVIGYFTDDNGTDVILRKPVVPVPTGQGQMGLAPFIMSSSYLDDGESLEFSRAHIVTSAKTSKQFADVYTQQVSGLDLSTTSKPGLII
jgi:hypothetical protein